MTTELNNNQPEEKKIEVNAQGGSSDTAYALGIIGAWIYYFKRAETLEEKVKAFFKGLIWPVFVVQGLLEFLEQQD